MKPISEMHKYILVDGKPQICNDLLEWAKWYEVAKRHVGDDKVGDARVSTVFLGLDHNFFSGPPILFETMVFGGKFDQEQERYSTIEEARAGHARWLAKVISGDSIEID